MKVIICKIFNEKDVERKISRLVSREKKRDGNNLRVFCVDRQTQERLKLAVISSEIYHEFARFDAEGESTLETLYELSDELHSSVENDDRLKYSGITFLSFEYCLAYYIYAIRLGTLFRSMAEENCGVLIVVVSKEYSTWLRNINSPNIKTINYDHAVASFMTRLYRHARYQSYQLLTGLFTLVKAFFSPPVDQHVPVQQSDQRQPRVLFVVGTPLYTRPALAISAECLREGMAPYAAINDRTLAPLWRTRQIGYSVKPPFFMSALAQAPRLGKMLRLFYRLKRHVNSFYDSSRHPDDKRDEFSARHLCERTLLDSLGGLCYEAIIDIIFAERLINMISPDIICLMPQDHLLQQMALALAKKKKNIPTLACSAAWEIGDSPSFQRHLRADKIATSGEKMRKMYLASGLEPKRVVATGIAHFDLLFQRDKEQDKRVLLEHAIDPAKDIIVFATDAYPFRETEEMLIGVINAALKIKDVQLVVKVHPREEAEPYQKMTERYHDARIKVFKDIDLYALLNNCKLLITKGSTVALEAMMIDRPVIIINLSGPPITIPYIEEGAAIGVKREQDIEPAILKALYDTETRKKLKIDRDKFVRNWAGEPDGKSAVRIVNLMKEMVSANAA